MAKKANTTFFFFEAFDEPWKGNPANLDGAEKTLGIV
jgi:exo-beta-1,3-glucanase (GH17 family)